MDNNTTAKTTLSFREQLEQLPAVVKFRETLARQRKEVEVLRAEHDAKKPKEV